MSGYNYWKTNNTESNNIMNVNVSLLSENAKAPTRNNSLDAGLDLYAAEDIFIAQNETKVVKTGVAIAVPAGYVGKIEDRSSMAAKGLRTGAGVVDSGYTGEVGVVIHNITNTSNKDPVLWRNGYSIKKGDKIAQILIYKVERPTVTVVSSLENSERGGKGFGSSGL